MRAARRLLKMVKILISTDRLYGRSCTKFGQIFAEFRPTRVLSPYGRWWQEKSTLTKFSIFAHQSAGRPIEMGHIE